jgi:hypothetical protein
MDVRKAVETKNWRGNMAERKRVSLQRLGGGLFTGLVVAGLMAIAACSSSNEPSSTTPTTQTCLDQGGSGEAEELQNMRTMEVVVASGDNPMPSEEFETYDPPPPWVVNSSERSVTFVESCLFRSVDAPADCSGDDCGIYQEISDYTWLQLAYVECETCLPADGDCPTSEPPGEGSVTVRRIRKCMNMTWVDQMYVATDTFQNEYVLHATPDGADVSLDAVLPDGWTLERRPLLKPFLLEPRGDDCSYTLLRDNLDQGYHQFTFVGEDALNAALGECNGVY